MTKNTLNQQLDTTIDTNSTKRIGNEVAKHKRVIGQEICGGEVFLEIFRTLRKAKKQI
jgi:hypothetical protein